MISHLNELITKYGFPVVAAGGVGYMVYYVWSWATKDIKPVLTGANDVLLALVDRIRMLDNDLIRLNQKVDVVLHLRGDTIEAERELAEEKINQTAEEIEESQEVRTLEKSQKRNFN